MPGFFIYVCRMKFKTLTILIAIAATALVMCLFAGCSTERQLSRKITKAKGLAYQHPLEFAEFCGKMYPPKDSVGSDSVIMIPSESEDYTGAIAELERRAIVAEERAKSDTTAKGVVHRQEIKELRQELSSLRSKYKPCKPSYLTTRTVYRTNTGTVASLQNKLNKESSELKEVKKQLDEFKSKASARMWWAIGLAAALGLSWFLFVRAALRRK